MPKHFITLSVAFLQFTSLWAQPIIVAGKLGQLDISPAGSHSIRITLKPAGLTLPDNPALAIRATNVTAISLRTIQQPLKKNVGGLVVSISQSPLRVVVTDRKGETLQDLQFAEDGSLSFALYGQPVVGMGEGGPKPDSGINWRQLPVEYDRRGRYHKMQPRWQANAYGSRNPVAMLIEPGRWGLFVAAPWVEVDLRNKDRAVFIPWKPTGRENTPQTVRNQGLNLGKGLPPIDQIIPGLIDLFVFDAHSGMELMKDFSTITGPAAMPPKWALGYMQSHRTLQDDRQMVGIVDSFRSKKIPVDAVIYLGTGFTPRGWNTQQPSFTFNPEVFKRDATAVVADMHSRNVKVVLHMVPWDRDKIVKLHGSIPAKSGETMDAGHIENYWKEHLGLINTGIDAFWPDEGDWFDLHERIKRHQLYYQGHLSADPSRRPWSLQRNGYPGIAQWGGWVWSGDTDCSWKTLEAQIAVGLNYAVSIGPYWGTDIGGFFPNEELTGELYARWFQFGAFCPSFRSHGVTWQTRLPWGWGLQDMGPKESRTPPLQSSMNNQAIEPIAKQYDELRYQLMPYSYTLARAAYDDGLPLMRPLWMHYPSDETSRSVGDVYLWGKDMLIAPVYEKGATQRKLYLPPGKWYDWWNNSLQQGGNVVNRSVDLATMPIYVRAGAIIPVDPVRQFAMQKTNLPTTLQIYPGADGDFTLYDDDGISQDYRDNKGTWIRLHWKDKERRLVMTPGGPSTAKQAVLAKRFSIHLISGERIETATYVGKPVTVQF